MGLRTKLKKFFLEKRIFIYSASISESLSEFIKSFNQNYVSVDLVRIGPEFDGGYLMPNILEKIDYCFSPGVGHTSEFERALYQDYKIKSFLLDYSVEKPAIQGDYFTFQKKFLGLKNNDKTIKLSTWINNNVSSGNDNLLLQMDIEGCEYEVLSFEELEVLKRFKCMIIEFHDFHKIFDTNFCYFIHGIFAKIFQKFKIVHAHVNSYREPITIGKYSVPPTLEVTFLREDILMSVQSNDNVQLPNHLDKPNSIKHKSLSLSEEWWKK